MVYIADFESFIQQAEEIYRARPLDTRYSIKYRHCDGKLVLKVTDDRRCIQYRTDQQQDLKKMERITTMFFALLASGDRPEEGGVYLVGCACVQVAACRTGSSDAIV